MVLSHTSFFLPIRNLPSSLQNSNPKRHTSRFCLTSPKVKAYSCMNVTIRAMYGYNSLLKKQEEQEALLPCLKPFILHTSDWSSSISCTISEQIEGWARAKAEGPSQQSDLPKKGWNSFWRSKSIFISKTFFRRNHYTQFYHTSRWILKKQNRANL